MTVEKGAAAGYVGVARDQSVSRIEHRQDRWDVEAEVAVVERVVRFHPELEMSLFCKVRVLENAELSMEMGLPVLR